VYVPGLCRTERGGDPIIVLDSDDAEAAEEVERRFGRTPGMVNTRRGHHALYRHSGGSLGKVASLRKFGLNADLKHGRSIVVAPPSIHPVSGTAYTWNGCDPSVIRDLPVFKAPALQDLIDRGQISQGADIHPSGFSQGGDFPPNVTPTAPAPGAPGMGAAGLRQDSRGLGINDRLCRHAWACDTRDELIDVARTINAAYPVPIDDDDGEVVKRANAVWEDRQAGKLTRWLGREGKAHASKSEIKDLSQEKNGGDALMLLMLFRAEHTARVHRGETFAINCRTMAECQSLCWTEDRIRNARDVLLRCGRIKLVTPVRHHRGGRAAAQYTLVLDREIG
jgi:hypothetical protein